MLPASHPDAFLCDDCRIAMIRRSTEISIDPPGLTSVWECPKCGRHKVELLDVN
jgi:hypothetical protein